MARIDFDLDDLTQAGLKRLVKQLLSASDEDEKKIIAKLGKHGPVSYTHLTLPTNREV